MAFFETKLKDEVPVLVVQGKLGLETLVRLEKELDALCQHQSPGLVLDLMACPYMCSRTFPPLLRVTEALAAEGRRLVIVCGKELLEILQILRLDQRLHLHSRRSVCLEEAHTFELSPPS
jgi:anti-anti-sigma factor